jgi:hypothetical protein
MRQAAESFRLAEQMIKLHMQGRHDQKSHGGGRGGLGAADRAGGSGDAWKTAAVIGGGAVIGGAAAVGARRLGRGLRGAGASHPGGLTQAGRARVRAAEATLVESPVEQGMIFDDDGTVLAHFKGHRYDLRIPFRHGPKLRGRVVTHNHPYPLAPSISDVYVAARYGVQETRVVTTRGTHRLRPPQTGWPPAGELRAYMEGEMANVLRDTMGRVGWGVDDYLKAIRVRIKQRRDFDAEMAFSLERVTNELMRRTARRFRLDYSVG